MMILTFEYFDTLRILIPDQWLTEWPNIFKLKQAEAELGQAQLNWKLDFAEAHVGAELGN